MNLISPLNNDKRIDNRPAFVIDISKEGNKAKIRGYERHESLQTASQYEEVAVDDNKISRYNHEVVRLLNRANKGGIVSKDILTKLKSTGQSLYDEIFSVAIKEKLNSTRSTDLILNIDDHLVEIPWELFYDGVSFLCLRFNMGRVVRTRQSLYGVKTRKISPPLNMFILANPKGDLKSASKEGIIIRARLESLGNSILVENKFTSINLSEVLDKIRNYDILHYAGHSDYDPQRPDQSGWLLKDEKFTAAEIMKMKGSSPMPSLVFANSCSSGQTADWKIHDNCMNQVFGLANAFLLTGVRHYIGTFREILDETGACFATAFYEALARQRAVGEALCLARQKVIREYGEETIVWAGYMLYGDPGVYYTVSQKGEESPEKPEIEDNEAKGQLGPGPLRSRKQKTVSPSVPQSHSKFIALFGVIVLAIFMVIGGIYMMRVSGCGFRVSSFGLRESPDKRVRIRAQLEEEVSGRETPIERVDDKEEYEWVNAMIDDLEKRHKNRVRSGGEIPRDEWTSRPLVLTVLPLNVRGAKAADHKEIILNIIAKKLRRKERIQIVERAIIAKILEEQRISSSELADHNKALWFGKLTGARFIVTGTLVFIRDTFQLTMKLVETETTSMIDAFSYDFLNLEEMDDLADRIAKDIETTLIHSFPFQGKIVSVVDDGVIINIGKNIGIEKGIRFKVLDEKNIAGNKKQIPGMVKKVEIGSIEIKQVYERYSFGTILTQKEDFEEGERVAGYE